MLRRCLLFTVVWLAVQATKCGPNESAKYASSLTCMKPSPHLKSCINKNISETYFTYKEMNSSTVEKSCHKFKSCIYSFSEDLNPYTDQFHHLNRTGLNQVQLENDNFFIPILLTKDGCYIENTVPGFKSIYEGNWKTVERFTKSIASRQDIKVVTGQFGHLKLNNGNGNLIDVNLELDPNSIDYDYDKLPEAEDYSTEENVEGPTTTRQQRSLLNKKEPLSTEVGSITFTKPRKRYHRRYFRKRTKKSQKMVIKAIKVPAFLYKIVKNKANDGLVFITANNPFLVDSKDVGEMCPRTLCKQIPEFLDMKKGYTYCCPVNEFISSMKRVYKMKLKEIYSAEVPSNINQFLGLM